MLKNLLRKLRRSPFEFPVAGGGTIGDIVCAPLDQKGVEFTVIDLGARNGIYHVPGSYSGRAKLIGFEPNPKEFKKLTAGATDMHKTGLAPPPFRHTEYHPYAVWRANERRRFYVTAIAGACTLMGESLPAVTEKMYLDWAGKRKLSFADITKVVGTEQIDCVALDDVLADDLVVDFLKLDVEGAEFACLEGARRLLESRRVLFIYSEFVTLPYYPVHDVLGAQHVFLNERGYRLIDLEMRHPTYRRGNHAIPETADRRLIHAGDAIYVLDPDRVDMDAVTRGAKRELSLTWTFCPSGGAQFSQL